MTKKKSERDIAIEKITSLFIERMQKTMTPEQGKELLKDLKTFSSKSRRSCLRGKLSRSDKNADSRHSSGAQAENS
jgi:hypothetical protein